MRKLNYCIYIRAQACINGLSRKHFLGLDIDTKDIIYFQTFLLFRLTLYTKTYSTAFEGNFLVPYEP